MLTLGDGSLIILVGMVKVKMVDNVATKLAQFVRETTYKFLKLIVTPLQDEGGVHVCDCKSSLSIISIDIKNFSIVGQEGKRKVKNILNGKSK